MGKISKKVLEKIEKENIKPIGRWSFVLKNSFLWSLFGLNILFGSLGLAISIYLFESSDILNLILSVNDFLGVLVLAIPTVWVLLTVIFLVVAYLNFRYTERGYTLSFKKIFLINTLAILILGSILHISGVSERLNRVFSESFSTYDITLDPRYKIWSSPETGYLAGTILSVSEASIELEDLDGNIWSIDISEAKVRRAVGLIEGEKIKIVGNEVDKNTFQALEILPWEGRGRNMQENHF
ncbi:MAG: hypothetical protein UR61_C0038G0006 [candidate division WS6 bacterium GW2011_GWE1_34_7]|uniref:Uncharacterized protein n=1 Tax=candidate division WS6 bacterium GW2011_GWE1_34_7 TaxID=1619093 RepID=A0A0G0BMG4_9BACT|nr:MAG: hypothetical protein UR61_C0038G0006 [candidate division WS6 bacterium GW2011_GWE1_34_7]